MSEMGGEGQPQEDSIARRVKRGRDQQGEDGPRKRQEKAVDTWEEYSSSLLDGFSSIDKTVMETVDSMASDLYDTVQLYKKDKPLFEFGLGKDESSWAAVKHYEQAEQGAPKYTPLFVAKPSKKKVKKATKKDIMKGPRERLEGELGFDFPTGDTGGQTTMVGSWPGEIAISHPTAKDASYNLQLLNAISQEFLNVIKSAEVEALALCDRVAVSANEAATVTSMLQKVASELIDKAPANALESWAAEKHDALKDLRSVLRGGTSTTGTESLVGMVVGASLHPEQAKTLKTSLSLIAQQEIRPVGPIDPEGKVTSFTSSAHANKLIVVNAILNSHAEQNLAVALLNSAYDKGKEIAVAGGKRPCTICYLSLCLTREVYPKLMFNVRPGGLYLGETVGGLWKIAVARNLPNEDIAERAKYYLKDEYKSYVTAINEYEELNNDQRKALGVTDDMLPRDKTVQLKKIEAQGLLTRTSTIAVPPSSQFDMQEFGEYGTRPEDLAQLPDDDEISDAESDADDMEVENLKEAAKKTVEDDVQDNLGDNFQSYVDDLSKNTGSV
jgi:hypothetical protein